MYEQYEQIVNDFSSPLCVIAGPGAGKTRLLGDRVAWLLNKDKNNKNKTTLLAYGKDAQVRMKTELTKPTGLWKLRDEQLPQIKTINALGLEIIGKNPQSIGLLDEDFKTQPDKYVKRLMFRDAAQILDYDARMDAKVAIECKQHGECHPNHNERKCQICAKYREIMCKCNRLDFDDQFLLAYDILEQDAKLLKAYQAKAQYLLVDEYQDINAGQFRLIQLLSRQSPNGLLVVGDDAQTIYRFRGADTKFILNFEKMFSSGRTRHLPYSHRVPKKIMEDALRIVNEYYPEYKGITRVQDLTFRDPKGETPDILQTDTEITEAQTVAYIARKSLQEKKDVLILIPDNKLFPRIISKLREYRVPYDCDENMLPSRIGKMMHFIRWLEQPNDNFLTRLVIEELINTGFAKVKGEKMLKSYRAETRAARHAEETNIAKLWQSVDEKHNLFSVIKKLQNPAGALATIQKSLNRLLELYKSKDTDKSSSFSQELLAASGAWKKPADLVDDLSCVRNLLEPQRPAIRRLARLRTMKKAKGLEAHVVIMVGLEKGIVPAPEANRAEEARLFYVSMTRAREKLYLLHSWRRSADTTYDKYNVTDRERSEFLNVLGRASRKIYHASQVEN